MLIIIIIIPNRKVIMRMFTCFLNVPIECVDNTHNNRNVNDRSCQFGFKE